MVSTRAPAAARGGPIGWFLRGGWYPFVVVGSLGLLSFVPSVHAALRTRRPLMWAFAVLYTAAVVAAFVAGPSTSVGGLVLGLMVVATVHSFVLRRQVWTYPPAAEPVAARPAGAYPAAMYPGVGDQGVGDPAPTDPAIAAVLAARRRRAAAREIVEKDALMARELLIGRPDLRPSYDDGGLVDLNSAPAPVIAGVCGIGGEVAERIGAARPFDTVDDVFALTDVPYELWERIRDRGVTIRT